MNRDQAKALTEKQWQATVVDLAEVYGWRQYHTFDSRRSSAGFPDLVLVRPPRLVFAELKSEKGVASDEQGEWLDDLVAVAEVVDAHASAERPVSVLVGVYLWRPSDFEEVSAVLRP